jgi:hypothetical protein
VLGCITAPEQNVSTKVFELSATESSVVLSRATYSSFSSRLFSDLRKRYGDQSPGLTRALMVCRAGLRWILARMGWNGSFAGLFIKKETRALRVLRMKRKAALPTALSSTAYGRDSTNAQDALSVSGCQMEFVQAEVTDHKARARDARCRPQHNNVP